MNEYDEAALGVIQRYHKKHGKYPASVEVTAVYGEKMTQTSIVCLDAKKPVNIATLLGSTPEPIEVTHTRIPVVPLGTNSITFRRLVVKNLDINLQMAECATAEAFQRTGAKLARSGLLIMEPKKRWGLQQYNPHLFFVQIEAWVFGQETILNEVLSHQSVEE